MRDYADYFKKDSGKPRVTYDEATEEALCFGWIDSVARKLDEQRSKLLFTPRKPKSGWSKLNKTRINFEAFPPSVKKGIYSLIESAKRAETRAGRIDRVVRMAALNLRAGHDKE